MVKEFYKANRDRFASKLAQGGKCIAVMSTGYEVTSSADENYPFFVNTNAYYFLGIKQPMTHLIMLINDDGSYTEKLYIDEYDAFHELWIGHRLTAEEASEICGCDISSVTYTKHFDNELHDLAKEYGKVWLDLEKSGNFNFNSFGLTMKERMDKIENVEVRDFKTEATRLRQAKQECEIEALKRAIHVTKVGIDSLMTHVMPGMYENQLEAYFDHVVKHNSNRKHSFKTIGAGGINATTIHYSENDSIINDNELVMFDLGCRDEEYCADITRTFPANGKFTPLQRTIYDIVLEANKKVLAEAKAGMTMGDLQKITVESLADGCLKAGLIKEHDEIKKYYVHGVSHSIGLDTHDCFVGREPLPVGAVISDEPGLYFPEYRIGVRIEDDILILEDHAENLSSEIIKEADEIEAYMAEHNKPEITMAELKKFDA